MVLHSAVRTVVLFSSVSMGKSNVLVPREGTLMAIDDTNNTNVLEAPDVRVEWYQGLAECRTNASTMVLAAACVYDKATAVASLRSDVRSCRAPEGRDTNQPQWQSKELGRCYTANAHDLMIDLQVRKTDPRTTSAALIAPPQRCLLAVWAARGDNRDFNPSRSARAVYYNSTGHCPYHHLHLCRSLACKQACAADPTTVTTTKCEQGRRLLRRGSRRLGSAGGGEVESEGEGAGEGEGGDWGGDEPLEVKLAEECLDPTVWTSIRTLHRELEDAIMAAFEGCSGGGALALATTGSGAEDGEPAGSCGKVVSLSRPFERALAAAAMDMFGGREPCQQHFDDRRLRR